MNFKITSEARKFVMEKGNEITVRIEKKISYG